MIDAANTLPGGEPAANTSPQITDFLSPDRVVIDLHVTSKKRLLEEMSTLFTRDNPGLSRETVFHVLIERERLGSTAIGQGVALPHGRINDLEEPIAAVARLRRPLDLEAPDREPVDLVIGLLVPAEANETHLQLLAGLASALSVPGARERIATAERAETVIEELGRCRSR